MTLLTTLAVAAAVAGQPGPPRPVTPPPTIAPAGPVVIYRMQQIVVGSLSEELKAELQPMHTLDEVEALLKANKLPFGWRDADIPSTQIAPPVLSQLANLPPHEVFVAPQGQGWIISVIVEQHPAGEAAPPSPAPSLRR